MNLSRFLSRYGCALLLTAWFWSISGLLVEQAYTLFLRPALGLLLVVALIVMIGFLFAEMQRWGHDRACGMDGATRLLILLAPLVYLPLARGASLDSRAFQHRWIDVSGTNAVSKTGGDRAITNAVTEADILELTYDPNHFNDRQVVVEGMLYRDPKIEERFGAGHCVLFRFVVSCCAADARPMALLMTGDLPAHWPDDTWVRAEGRFILPDREGQSVPTLEVTNATRIPKPGRPYLY